MKTQNPTVLFINFESRDRFKFHEAFKHEVVMLSAKDIQLARETFSGYAEDLSAVVIEVMPGVTEEEQRAYKGKLLAFIAFMQPMFAGLVVLTGISDPDRYQIFAKYGCKICHEKRDAAKLVISALRGTTPSWVHAIAAK